MFNPSISLCSAKISYSGVAYPNSGSMPGGYLINLAHPYAGMGIDLELKKVTGWENKTVVLNGDFSNRLEPITAPGFTADAEDIVLTYAYYTPGIDKPLKPDVWAWRAMPIFNPGSTVTITQKYNDISVTREGIIVSRIIYHNEKVPTLEVVIRPYYAGWKQETTVKAGSFNGVLLNISSHFIGPIPFTFDASGAVPLSGGTLNIDLFVKRNGSYINVPKGQNYKPEPITDRLTFYGPQVVAQQPITFHIDTAFPFNATIETESTGIVSLARYLYNEGSGYVLSSPRLFIPGGNMPVNIWCEMRVNNTVVDVPSQFVKYEEFI